MQKCNSHVRNPASVRLNSFQMKKSALIRPYVAAQSRLRGEGPEVSLRIARSHNTTFLDGQFQDRECFYLARFNGEILQLHTTPTLSIFIGMPSRINRKPNVQTFLREVTVASSSVPKSNSPSSILRLPRVPISLPQRLIVSSLPRPFRGGIFGTWIGMLIAAGSQAG